MTDSRAAVGFDRLPWLADEPERPARDTRRDLIGWAVAGVLLIAGASYWLGQRTANEPASSIAPRSVPRSTTVPLPAPQPVQSQVQPDRLPEVEPLPAPIVSVPRPTVERYHSGERGAVSTHKEAAPSPEPRKAEPAPPVAAQPVVPKVAPVREQSLTLWPARVSQGAGGRLVQIGAFGTRLQAKLGWRHMVRAYPAVMRLPAVVVQTRNSRGRYFYRFQIGTTSQAHSEVLCQRMEKILFSCAVVGLPGARQAVER